MLPSHLFFLPSILLIGFTLSSNANPEFSEKISADVISRICAEISNTTFCLGILNSDPRVKTADLKGVAGILVQRAYLDANATKSKVTLLAQKETNPDLRNRYARVAAYLQVITNRVANAKGNLDDTNNIYIQAEASLAKIYSCEDLFLYPAPKEPTDLLWKIKELDDLLTMIMANATLMHK